MLKLVSNLKVCLIGEWSIVDKTCGMLVKLTTCNKFVVFLAMWIDLLCLQSFKKSRAKHLKL